MALESATYINQLVNTNPTGSDQKAQGDDHIRLIKAVLQSTFPNINGAVNATPAELNYLVGVTSALQTQLNAKAPLSAPTFTGLITASGGQIAFPAVRNASADPNTLDDYEEEEWTPNVGGTATYLAQIGKITKIGRMAFVSAYMQINVIGSGSQNTIYGLPVTAIAEGSAAVYFSSLALTITTLVARITNASNAISLNSTTAASTALLGNNILSNGSTVTFSMSFPI